jgi:transcriptional regulator with XRE-family HTH domain
LSEFELSKTLRAAREKAAMTQQELAAAVGCHPSFIAKIEKSGMGGSLPSRELADSMAGALGLVPNDLWKQVEAARAQMMHRRLRTRGASLAQTMAEQGIPIELLGAKSKAGSSLDDMIAGITVDPAVRAAVKAALPHLVTAMIDPDMRQIVDAALRGWAQLSQRKQHRRRNVAS